MVSYITLLIYGNGSVLGVFFLYIFFLYFFCHLYIRVFSFFLECLGVGDSMLIIFWGVVSFPLFPSFFLYIELEGRSLRSFINV